VACGQLHYILLSAIGLFWEAGSPYLMHYRPAVADESTFSMSLLIHDATLAVLATERGDFPFSQLQADLGEAITPGKRLQIQRIARSWTEVMPPAQGAVILGGNAYCPGRLGQKGKAPVARGFHEN